MEVENDFKNLNLQPWQQRMLDALEERRVDFLSVGKNKLAEKISEKQDHYRARFLSRAKQIKKTKSLEQGEFRWGREYLNREMNLSYQSILKNKSLIPRYEFKGFERKLADIKKNVSTDPEVSYLQLREVREGIVARYQRSVRAMAGHREGFWKPVEKDVDTPKVVSHYNDAATLEKLMSTLAATDPIWVGDFMNFYKDLLDTADILSQLSGEKKKK